MDTYKVLFYKTPLVHLIECEEFKSFHLGIEDNLEVSKEGLSLSEFEREMKFIHSEVIYPKQ